MNESRKRQANKHHGFQLVGLLLWRTGLLVAGATALFRIARVVLRVVDLPPQLEIGIALTLVGLVFVVGSLVLERYIDYKSEGDLRHD